MSNPGKRWWHISASEFASVTGIMAFVMAILAPATINARAYPKRAAPARLSPTELWLLRSMERVGYHGWVYLGGAVFCGACAAAVVYLVAAVFHRRSNAA